jgi:hypothetical protein
MFTKLLTICGASLMGVSLSGLVYAQASTVTQRFLGAPVPNAVVAVELDAAPSRSLTAPSAGPSSIGMTSVGQPTATYAERIQSLGSPSMYTGAASVGR